MKEQKDVRQRIEEGEFAQSAEISASYLDEDILIIDNLKVLQNPISRYGTVPYTSASCRY